MNTVSHWLASGRDWLDARGRAAWIVSMILGFVFIWPVGLALLIYMIGSNRMSRNFMMCKQRGNYNVDLRFRSVSTGNTAFDSYRDETLKRLDEEQTAFQSFIERLREAKDRAEFDQFMDDRSKSKDVDGGAEPA